MKYKNQWEFLEKQGLLAEGVSEEALLQGKREWRKLYKRLNKQKQRRVRKEVTVSFVNHKQWEQMKLRAGEAGLSLSEYLIQAGFSQLPLMPQAEAESIAQSFAILQVTLQQLLFAVQDDEFPNQEFFTQLQKQIEELTSQTKLLCSSKA